jgi:hypothetical protein
MGFSDDALYIKVRVNHLATDLVKVKGIPSRNETTQKAVQLKIAYQIMIQASTATSCSCGITFRQRGIFTFHTDIWLKESD